MTALETLELILRRVAEKFPSATLAMLIDELTDHNNQEAAVEEILMRSLKEDQ